MSEPAAGGSPTTAAAPAETQPAIQPPPPPIEAPAERPWRRHLRRLLAEARDVVEEFFLSPTTGEAGGLFRIAFGLLVVYYLAFNVGLNLERYYSDLGILPYADYRSTDASKISLLAIGPSQVLLHAVWIGALVSSVLFTLGCATRVTAALTYVGLASFYNRNPWLMNAGDHLVVTLTFLCIVAPVGLRYSVDSWFRRYRAKLRGLPAEPPRAAMFGLGIMRLLVCFVYLSSFVHKMSNSSWRKGEAVTRILDSTRFASGMVDFDSFPIFERMATWGTLLVEGVFLLALLKRWRPWILVAGIGLHISIELFMKIPMFTAVMLISYIALLDDGEVRWLLRPLLGRFVDPPATAVSAPVNPSSPEVPATAVTATSEAAIAPAAEQTATAAEVGTPEAEAAPDTESAAPAATQGDPSPGTVSPGA
jgi:hypothetical protein